MPKFIICTFILQFEEVEDLMDKLVGKSLARKIITSPDVLVSSTFYSVHNLQLTFLQEQCSDTESLHRKLVERYRKVYKGTYLLFTLWEVRIEKNFARGLECTDRPRLQAMVHALRSEGKVFLYTDRPRLVNNLFIFPLKFSTFF